MKNEIHDGLEMSMKELKQNFRNLKLKVGLFKIKLKEIPNG